MQNFIILNSKEVKSIVKKLKECYGIKEINMEYAFIKDHDKLFIVSREFKPIYKTRLDSIGLYFARIVDNAIRLTIEGSQIIGKYATKNIIELDNENLKKWMAGLELEANENPEAVQDQFILVKHKDDFFGSCKIHDNKIMNFIPKDRRVYRLNEANKSQDII